MIILIIIGLIYILHKFSKVNEGPVVLIFANLRVGKTTLLTRYAQRELKLIKKGKSKYNSVITNTPISGCIYVPKLRELLKNSCPEKTLILVDEGSIVWNNRKQNLTDHEIEYLKLIGHYESKLVVISQSAEDIDITIRRIYTSMYLLNKIGQLTLIRPIKKFITIDKETQQMIEGYKFNWVFAIGYIFRPKYYSYFDTHYKPDGYKASDYSNYETISYKSKDHKKYFLFKKIKSKNDVSSGDTQKLNKTTFKGEKHVRSKCCVLARILLWVSQKRKPKNHDIAILEGNNPTS